MIQDLLDGFLAGKVCGAKAIILPKGREDAEAVLVDEVIRRAYQDDKRFIFARGEPKAFSPFASIRDALLGGYGEFKGITEMPGMMGRLGRLIMTGIVEKIAGQTVATDAKEWISQSPVSCLQASTVNADALAQAIRGISADQALVLYVRKAYRDHADSRTFLCRYCGDLLDQMTEHVGRILVIFCLREEDLAQESGKEIQQQAKEFEFLEVANLEPQPTPSGKQVSEPTDTLEVMLEKAPEEIFTMLEYICTYCAASESKEFSEQVLLRACGLKSKAELEWLKKAGIIELLAHEMEATIWGITDRYDCWDLEEAIAVDEEEDGDEAADDSIADEEETETEEDTSEEEDTEDQPDEGEENSAGDLFSALKEIEDVRPGNIHTLIQLACMGYAHTTEGLRLVGNLIEEQAKAGNVEQIDSELENCRQLFQNVFYQNRSEDYEWSDDDLKEAGQALTLFAGALEHLGQQAWGPVQSNLANRINEIFSVFSTQLSKSDQERINLAVVENRGYLCFLTDQGRMKLVSMESRELQPRTRNTPGNSCLRNLKKEGCISELQTVSRSQMALLFCSNGEVVTYPLHAIDAIYEEYDPVSLFCSNMPAILGLQPLPDVAGETILATCPYDSIPNEGCVLLASESGKGLVIPVSELPSTPGQRIRVNSSLLSRAERTRWAILVQPDEDVFVGNTENNILRLKGADLLEHSGKEIPALMEVPTGSQLAAVIGLKGGSEISSCLFIATDGGYGRMVATSEFPYGKLGGAGVAGQKIGKRSGSLCTIETVPEYGNLIFATKYGEVLCVSKREIPIRKRANVGVKMISMQEGDTLVCACSF